MADSNKTEKATPRQRQEGAKAGPGHAFARADQRAFHVCRRRRGVPHGPRGGLRIGRTFSATRLTLPAPTRSSPTARCSSGPVSKRCAGCFRSWLRAAWCRWSPAWRRADLSLRRRRSPSSSSASARRTDEADVFAGRAQHHSQVAAAVHRDRLGRRRIAFTPTGPRFWAAPTPMRAGSSASSAAFC